MRRTVEACGEAGVPYLTVYAFSVDNWRRPGKEVSFLMRLLRRYLLSEGKRLAGEGVRLRAIGDLGSLPKEVRQALKQAIALSRRGKRLTLTLALGYGGRREMVRAAQAFARTFRAGKTGRADTTDEGFRRFLWTRDLPPVDLLIRTGGEKRLSDFILYDAAYAELYFTDVLWPDFDAGELSKALHDYASRERRFGALPGEA